MTAPECFTPRPGTHVHFHGPQEDWPSGLLLVWETRDEERWDDDTNGPSVHVSGWLYRQGYDGCRWVAGVCRRGTHDYDPKRGWEPIT